MRFEADRWVFQRTGEDVLGALDFANLLVADDPLADGAPLPTALALALKSYLTTSKAAPATARTVVDGVRHFWAYLRSAHAWTAFDWYDLRPALLEGFGAFMLTQRNSHSRARRPLGPETRAIREQYLNAFLAWVAGFGIISESCQVTRSAYQKAFRGARRPSEADLSKARLPDRRAVEALASLYTSATDPYDRLFLCLCGILLISGMRESEVRDLPLDCLELEQGPDGERVRFRYWARKAYGSTYYYAHRWLSPLGAELAKRLVNEVRELTVPCRALASRLEASGGRFSLPFEPGRLMLTVAEAQAALKLTSTITKYSHEAYARLQRLPWEGPLPPGRKATKSLVGIRVSDIENALQEIQSEFSLIAYRAPDGTTQRLSETLFITADHPTRQLDPRCVRKLSHDMVSRFLGGDRSVFRRSFTDPTQTGFAMRTHGFRHWLNTLANKAGLTVFLITVWMQRRVEAHTHAYLWEAPELADIARHDVLDLRLVGGPADVVHTLPVAEREDYLDDAIRVAHVGPGGLLCTKEFIHDECGRQQACAGCGHVLAEVGNDGQAAFLRERARTALEVSGLYAEVEQNSKSRVVPRLHTLATEAYEAAMALADRIVPSPVAR